MSLFGRALSDGDRLEVAGTAVTLRVNRRARLFGPLVPDLDRDAAQVAQRNALFSFVKKLSSWR